MGQFNYGQPSCTTDRISTCISKDEEYNKWVYIGEVKEGTDDTPHGIGIKVYSGGGISEGYWKDGKQHGRGRFIYCGGRYYYIGEWKEGNRHGEGIEYWVDGDRYEGGWKNDNKYGQGTYYFYGDKYTGQWDDEKGQGQINYKDGTKYKGQWDYYVGLKRHGLGTLFSADGQVLNQGKWDKGKYVGKE